MTTATRLAGGSALASFSHLISPTRAAAAHPAAETEDEKKDREDKERNANKAATGRAETDDEREDREDEEREKNKKASGKAETDDERRDREASEEDDEDDDPDDSGKGRRARGENDDEDEDDEEMKAARKAGHSGALRAARRAERRRITSILTSKAAAGQFDQAVHLACNTSMTAAAAKALLRSLPRASGRSEPPAAQPLSALDRAMGLAQNRPNLGPGGTAQPPSALDAAMSREVANIEAHRAHKRGRL